MEVLGLQRKFIMKTSKGDSPLEDLDGNWSPERIKGHYASLYPELTNAKTEDRGIVDGFHEIAFKTIAGTKG